jgi:hypothetical protein
MALTRPPFPRVIDSSMISTFRACPRKFQLEYLLNWKPKAESVHLVAGKAFARGLEVARQKFFDEDQPADYAIAEGIGALLEAYGTFECPEDSAKSATRMAGAMEYYFEKYPLGADNAPPHILGSGSRAIEFSFLEPLESEHPETFEPLLYSGRFDMVCDYAGGVFGEDDKTTSSLGASWSKQWDLRSQFTAYCWGAGMGGLHLQGFLVRGVSILKTKYETQQAVTYRPPWMIERWYEQTLRDIARMKEMWEAGAFDYNLDHSCNEYGGCMFRQVCLSSDVEPWLEAGFERRRWDPVLRIEEVVE